MATPEFVIDDEMYPTMVSIHGHLTAIETRRMLDALEGWIIPDMDFLERVRLARAAVHSWRVNEPAWCGGNWWVHCNPDVDGAEPFTDVDFGVELR